MQKVQIPCPGCGITLKVPNPNNAEAVNCQCPKCGKSFEVLFRKQSASASTGPLTVLPGNQLAYTTIVTPQPVNDGATQLGGIPPPDREKTQLGGQAGHSSQLPRLVCRGREYTLQPGRNVVGRKSTQKPADIMLDVDDRFMSRQHIAVTVTRLSNGTIRATVQNYRNTNETHVDGHPLASGEEVILNHDTTIKIGDTEIVYRHNPDR